MWKWSKDRPRILLNNKKDKSVSLDSYSVLVAASVKICDAYAVISALFLHGLRRTDQAKMALKPVPGNIQEEMNSIPLADDDPQDIIPDESEAGDVSQSSDNIMRGRSMDSIPSTFTNGSSSPGPNSLDPDVSPDEQEEKARFISQVLELQNTLDDLSQRVDSVKEENLKLRSENQVLGQYIENLMAASSVFQSAEPKGSKK